MTYSKKKATRHANCVSLITEERAREIVDKRDREANALFNIINSLGSIYLTYFEALKKLNEQFNFSRTNPALSKAFGFFGDMEKCVSYADRAMKGHHFFTYRFSKLPESITRLRTLHQFVGRQNE